MTIFTSVAPFLLVLVALWAAESVRRGAPPLRAYSVALAGATCTSAGTQFLCRQALAIHATSGSASATVKEWVWIGSDAASVILLGGIALLAFYNHRSVERILQSVRTAELKSVRLERELIESRLATAQAQIDPRALFDSLARIRNLYASSPSEADRAAELEDGTEKSAVTPGPLSPAREMLGEMLLQMNEPAQALKQFEATLKKEPRRFRSLYGAAYAARLSGSRDTSQRYFRELLSVCAHSDKPARPELQEAQQSILQK
jgi:hypothetical protein